MFSSCNSFLYLFDIIGTTPQLFIFKNKRYKSIFSSLLSIIIIFISIAFSILSLVDYLKYDNPNIIYFKNNDKNGEINFLLKDFLLVFQLVDSIDSTTFNILNESICHYVAYYHIIYNNGTIFDQPLNIKKCEFGKYLDSEYHNLVNENTYGRTLDEFYCLNTKDNNLSLFYDPNIGFSIITLDVIFNNNSIYTPEKIYSLIVTENDLIDHYNKKVPISKGYDFHFSTAYNSLEYTKISYTLQYIKYESDESLIFKNSRTLKGLSFLSMDSFRVNIGNSILQNNFQSSNIGKIEILINRTNFDNYKRSYEKLQNLLAGVMSIINILLEVGRQIANILCSKKMNKDIIEYLINKKQILKKEKNKKNVNNVQLKINNEIKETIVEKDIIDKTNVVENLENIEKSCEIQLNKPNENNNNTKNKKIKVIKVGNNKAIKKINYCNIIKSFFGFKDKKSKLINLCHAIVNEDMCVEKLLERLYNLENVYSYLSKDNIEKISFIKNKRFNEIYKFIYEVNIEEKKVRLKEENNKDLRINIKNVKNELNLKNNS